MSNWLARLAVVGFCTTNLARAESSPALTSPQVVQISSKSGQLSAYLWTPTGPGPFPAVLFNHGRSGTPQQHNRRLTITAAAQVVGPVFARHGYVLLFPFRHGEGLSSSAGPFIGDQLDAEEAAKGAGARRHLQVTLLTTTHLDDGMAALEALKRLPRVDASRITVVGHSLGGQLALLEAARDPTVRAAVAFGPAAGSWESSGEVRSLLLGTIDKIVVPVMLIHSLNDYSVAPGRALGEEFARLSKPYVLKIYPAVGDSSSDGHNFLFIDTAIWEADVFQFLGQSMQH